MYIPLCRKENCRSKNTTNNNNYKKPQKDNKNNNNNNNNNKKNYYNLNVYDLHSFATQLQHWTGVAEVKARVLFKPFCCYSLSSITKLQRLLTLKSFPSAVNMKFQ